HRSVTTRESSRNCLRAWVVRKVLPVPEDPVTRTPPVDSAKARVMSLTACLRPIKGHAAPLAIPADLVACVLATLSAINMSETSVFISDSWKPKLTSWDARGHQSGA